MIKYVYGYNHYGKRDKMINDYMVETICPRCELIKTQEYVIQYDIKRGRLAFAKDLIETFAEDIMKYVRNNNIGEYKTNQQYVRMKELFHGYVVID